MAQEELKLLIKQHGMKNVKSALKDLDNAAGKTSASFASIAASIGLTVAAGAGLRAVINSGKEFEEQMASTKAVTFDASLSSKELQNQYKRLEDNARSLGGSTLYTATQVAGLQTEFAKLGFSVTEIENMSKATLDLSLVAGVELGQASEVAGQTLRAFGMDATESTEMIDVMAKSFSSSALDIDKFANSMTYVAPVAASAGFTMQETTSVLGALANVGIDGSIAGTQLRLIFGELANESSKLSKKLGGPIDNMDDLIPALKQLKDDGFDVSEAFDLVGRRAGPALIQMVEQADDLENLSDKLENASGAAGDMANVKLDTFSAQMALLGSATTELNLKMFDLVKGPLKDMITGFAKFVEGIDEEEVKAYAAGLGVAASAAFFFSGGINKATAALIRHRAALVSTGYGALAVMAGLAAGAVLDFMGAFETETEETEENAEQTKKLVAAKFDLKGAYDDLNKSISSSGDSLTTQIAKLENELDGIENALIAQEAEIANLDPLSQYLDKQIFDIDTKGKNIEPAIKAILQDVLVDQSKLFQEAGGDVDQYINRFMDLVPAYEGTSSAFRNQVMELFTINKQTGELQVRSSGLKNIQRGLSKGYKINSQRLLDLKKGTIDLGIVTQEQLERALLQILRSEDEIKTLKNEKEVTEDLIETKKNQLDTDLGISKEIERYNAALKERTDKEIANNQAVNDNLATLMLEKDGIKELTADNFDLYQEKVKLIQADLDSGLTKDEIINKYMLEGNTITTLTERYGAYLEKLDENNTKSAENIAFKIANNNTDIEMSDTLVNQIELLKEQGLSYEQINYAITQNAGTYDQVAFAISNKQKMEENSIKFTMESLTMLDEWEQELAGNKYIWQQGVWTSNHEGFKKSLDERKKALRDANVSEDRIEKWARDQRISYWSGSTKAALGSMTSGFKAMASIHGSYSKGAKNAAKAMAIINTLESATNTAKSVPFPLNILAVAGALAQGYAQVKQIDQQDADAKFSIPTATIEEGTATTGGGGDSGYIPGQYGLDGVVTQPTTFLAGEEGRDERITITPLTEASKRTSNMGGGTTYNINISAPTLDDSVVDSIIPAINRAVQNGEVLLTSD